MLLLRACEQLAVDESGECLGVGGVLDDGLLIALDGHLFVLLCFIALGLEVGLAAVHLLIAVGGLELGLEHSQALLVLFVLEEGPGG